MELKINAERWAKKERFEHATGIFIRALSPEGKWESVDIVFLDKSSLLEWLKSRGGNNPCAENVVGILLGYGNLHSFE